MSTYVNMQLFSVQLFSTCRLLPPFATMQAAELTFSFHRRQHSPGIPISTGEKRKPAEQPESTAPSQTLYNAI